MRPMITVDLKEFEEKIDDYIQLMEQRIPFRISKDHEIFADFYPHQFPKQKT